MRQLYLLAAAIAIVWGAGCNIINPQEAVPTYVHIDSIMVADSPARGSTSHRITNATIYFNNQSVGVFDLPVTFPVIMDGPGTLQVSAGINYNGLSGYNVPYPFYQSYSQQLSPAPGKVVNLQPVVRYTPASYLAFEENFENGNPAFDRVGNSPVPIVLTSAAADVFEGQHSGSIHLVTGQDSTVNASKNAFALSATQETYVELNYKSTMRFQIGLTAVGQGRTEYVLGLSPRATWGKVYIGIRSFVAAHPNDMYKLAIRAVLPAGTAEGTVMLDNIKALSY